MASQAPLKPFFSKAPAGTREPPEIQAVLDTLRMQPHIEGGYFVETDRDPLRIATPFAPDETAYPWSTSAAALVPARPGFDPALRNASTTIFYLLTPATPQGNFHRNRARTVHTLHRGRGRYVVIHADEGRGDGGCRVETFVVGQNVAAGEKLQWIVEGGKYKASFLLPDREGGEASSGGLLISETVVPGFEFCDHDFMAREKLGALVAEDKAKELEWLVRG